MIQIALINSLILWTRRLEEYDERRINHRFDPYVNFLAVPKTLRTVREQKKDNRANVDLEQPGLVNW